MIFLPVFRIWIHIDLGLPDADLIAFLEMTKINFLFCNPLRKNAFMLLSTKRGYVSEPITYSNLKKKIFFLILRQKARNFRG